MDEREGGGGVSGQQSVTHFAGGGGCVTGRRWLGRTPVCASRRRLCVGSGAGAK